MKGLWGTDNNIISISLLQEGYGARLKKLLILSDSKAVELFTKVIKQCVSEKIGNRIKCHRTHQDLYEEVPKEILPIEYGGNERSIETLQGNDDSIQNSSLKYLRVVLQKLFCA